MPHTSLQESLERLKQINFRNILDSMIESIWIGDEYERTVYANPNFCNLLGYTLEEMLGRESYDFWDEESIKIVKKNNELRKEWEASKYEWLLKAKNGDLIPVLLSGTPIGNGWTAGIMTDLREINAVKEQKRHLEEVNALKDEFVSIVGHELRTPLTLLKWYLSMVSDGDAGEVNDTVKKFLKIAYDESERLIGLVNDVLDVGKLESGRMFYNDSSFLIADLLRDIHERMLIGARRKNIHFECTIEEALEGKKISMDRDRLNQVLINLIGNSFKFTEEGGTVSIHAVHKWEKLELSIIDNGIWMPKKQLKQIFEKFKQIDHYLQRHSEGAGLGLFICKQILEHYEIELQVSSNIWHGSTFFFEIPYSS